MLYATQRAVTLQQYDCLAYSARGRFWVADATSGTYPSSQDLPKSARLTSQVPSCSRE